jgi:hypothetical protein
MEGVWGGVFWAGREDFADAVEEAVLVIFERFDRWAGNDFLEACATREPEEGAGVMFAQDALEEAGAFAARAFEAALKGAGGRVGGKAGERGDFLAKFLGIAQGTDGAAELAKPSFRGGGDRLIKQCLSYFSEGREPPESGAEGMRGFSAGLGSDLFGAALNFGKQVPGALFQVI